MIWTTGLVLLTLKLSIQDENNEIFDLESGIQTICKDGSKDEVKNPTRKQFMTYLKGLKTDDSTLLEEYINAIHKYKTFTNEFKQFMTGIENGDIPVDQ